MPHRATDEDDQVRQRQGARVRELRDWLGLTQTEFSQWITGNPQSTKSGIASAEQGIRPIPTEALYETFGLSQDWVLCYTDGDWWGPEVQRIRTHLSRWLNDLPPDANAQYRHPGARVAASYEEIAKASALVTDRYAAAILGIAESQWREVLGQETYVSQEQWGRWALWTGLPELWIAKGQLPKKAPADPEPDPYTPVIEEARQVGVSPEKLLSMIRLLAK